MRFVHLSVESFKAIRSAEIAFGPGLNILHGPNDLGKSTLATAIQAALLVAPGSAEAEGYLPWHADVTPRVTLTFVDDGGRYWRVKKTFGDEQTAELHSSKDGLTFSLECRAREVEEKLRASLAWGIAPPGGKGGPRGLPTSFLTNALLAPQTDVDAILSKSLATDAVATGKVRLSSALATLAQDPLFKRVLDAAQAEVNGSFTPKGKLKRGVGSPFVQASNAVKQLQDELVAIQQQRDASKAVEAEVNSQRARYAQALIDAAEARTQAAAVQLALEAGRARQAVQGRLIEAQAEVAKIDAQGLRVAKLEAEVGHLELAANELSGKVRSAQEARAAAETGLRQAEEALRLASSEDGARKRELEIAQLEARASQLRARLQEAEARKEKAAAAIAAAELAEKARLAARAAAAEVTRAKKASALEQQQLVDATAEVELSRAVLAYGRWRVASAAAEESAKAEQLAFARRKDAAEREVQAAALEADQGAKQAQIAAQSRALPTAAQLEALQKLEQALALAEAALDGGGLSVAIRSRGQTAVRAVVDGKAEGAGELLPDQAQLEARRSVMLSVGDTVEIEVTAGSPDKRRAVERLGERWGTEGAPILSLGGAGTTVELARAVAAHAADRQALAVSAKELERLRLEVSNLRDQAARYEEQALSLATEPAELARLKASIGSAEETHLAAAFQKLGKSWESQLDSLRKTRERKLELLKEQAKAAEQAASIGVYKASQAAELADSQLGHAASLAKDLGTTDPRALLRAIEEECTPLAQQEVDLKATLLGLVEGAGGEVAEAQQVVKGAMVGLGAAEVALAEAERDLASAQAAFHGRAGECAQAKLQLHELDRSGAEAALGQRKQELAELPAVAAVSEGDLAQGVERVDDAERALDRVKQELHTSEGALSKVGGSALGEEALRLEEALEVARQREKDLEVDAEAWKLLQETLRAVENEEGAHLGRALAQPLSKKFAELTGDRYEGLKIDAALKTEGLGVAGTNTGDDDVLKALSVGTRDQLATLIRLTIAEQLKTAIVLDDHLVHTDPARLGWFVDAFLKAALESQVVVLTCRPGDYLESGDVSDSLPASRDVAGGRIRVVDVGRVLQRWGGGALRPTRLDS